MNQRQMQKLETDYNIVYRRLRDHMQDIVNQNPRYYKIDLDDYHWQCIISAQTISYIDTAKKINEIIDKIGGGV